MSQVGARERLTQQQVLHFLEDELDSRYLGDWKDCGGNCRQSDLEDGP